MADLLAPSLARRMAAGWKVESVAAAYRDGDADGADNGSGSREVGPYTARIAVAPRVTRTVGCTTSSSASSHGWQRDACWAVGRL